MSLLEFQRRMAADVMRPLAGDETMLEQLDDGSSLSDHAAAYVKPNRLLSAFERLEIYNRQYWFRVLAALTEDFPALEAVIGAEQFELLARDYLAAHPSRSFTLRNLGGRLPAWLTAHPDFAGDRAELAIDVASLEWAYAEAFDLAEFTPIGPDEIAALNDDSPVGLQPHVQLLALHYAVDDLVLGVHRSRLRVEAASQASNRQAGPESHPSLPIPLAEMDRCDIWMAVHRHNLVVHYKRLAGEEYKLLTALSNGNSLGDALEAAFLHSSISPGEQPAMVSEWFGNWAELGWLCSAERTPIANPERIS
ncbi:MAG: DNA-binding domain-containing protein [Terracidiphilus sp.]|jgi:hypothetical protein